MTDMISKTAALDAAPSCFACGWHDAIAALPAVTPTVRSLQWDDSNSYCLVAETSLGEYVVQDEQDDGWGLWTPQQEQGDDPVSYHPDALTAKAAAQAHFDAAIRAEVILTPSPNANESIAWQSATPCYTQFLTDAQYQRLGEEFRKWYVPYRCPTCTAPPAPDTNQKGGDALARSRSSTHAPHDTSPGVTAGAMPAPDAAAIREAALREAYDAVGRIVASHERKEDFRAEEIAGQCHDAILALIQKGGA